MPPGRCQVCSLEVAQVSNDLKGLEGKVHAGASSSSPHPAEIEASSWQKWSGDKVGPLTIRRAGDGDTVDGLKWILSHENALADEGRVVDFLRYSVGRKIDLSRMGVIEREGHVEWAILPIVSPGRSMLLLSPGFHLKDSSLSDAAHLLIKKLITTAPDVRFVQGLVDPQDSLAAEPFYKAGFEKLARLVYLQRTIQREPVRARPPEGLQVVTYSPATHDLFKRALADSYIDSQDCVRLNGVRDLDDVIENHKYSGGIFVPELWSVLVHGDQPAAISLLNPTETSETMELVYLGVSKSFRRAGLAHWLLRQAMVDSFTRGLTKLTLAVDSENAPALRVYFRFGMKRVHERLALVKLL